MAKLDFIWAPSSICPREKGTVWQQGIISVRKSRKRREEFLSGEDFARYSKHLRSVDAAICPTRHGWMRTHPQADGKWTFPPLFHLLFSMLKSSWDRGLLFPSWTLVSSEDSDQNLLWLTQGSEHISGIYTSVCFFFTPIILFYKLWQLSFFLTPGWHFIFPAKLFFLGLFWTLHFILLSFEIENGCFFAVSRW